MKAIYKYQLMVCEEQIIPMAKNAKFLTVQEQFDKPVLWTLVDLEEEQELKMIITYTTGYIPTTFEHLNLEYIGTYQLTQGKFVGHVFVKI